MMYNEFLKLNFIKDCNTFKEANKDIFEKKITRWFSDVAEYEKKLGKDLSDFTVKEIMEMYKIYLCTSSTTTLEGIHGYLRRYTAYAHERRVDKSGLINHYDEVTYEMLSQCISREAERQKIVLREDLLEAIKEFDNPCEQAFVLGMFEGLSLKDFDVVDFDHIDENKRCIEKASGVKINVSSELITYLLNSIEEYEYVYEDRTTQLDPSDNRVFKNTASGGERITRYHNFIKKMKMKYEYTWLTIPGLEQSGIIDMLLQAYKANPALELSAIASLYNQDIQRRFDNKWRYTNRFQIKFGYLFS